MYFDELIYNNNVVYIASNEIYVHSYIANSYNH